MIEKKYFINELKNKTVNYGKFSKNLNPTMAPYIISETNNTCLIDVIKMTKFLYIARNILQKKANSVETVLFVGTTESSSFLVEKYAKEHNFFYINHRWLGGMLTNWTTLQKRLVQLKELEGFFDTLRFKILSKKEQNQYKKELCKLQKMFNGIKNMTCLPSIVVFTDPKKDLLAIQECIKLGIITICILNTDSNLDIVPYPIMSNEKAFLSLDFILKYLCSN